MRVFVTGATGFVGQAVTAELLANGHELTGLARSEASARKLREAGARPVAGSLADLDTLARAADNADAVIHLAFGHDFSRFEENAAEDIKAIEAMGSALIASNRPIIATSGAAMLQSDKAVPDEYATAHQPDSEYPRGSETALGRLREQGVNAIAMRLPPSVHGVGETGFVPILIEIARQKGTSAYVDDGTHCWSAVYQADAGRAYRLAMETGARGNLHAVAEEAIPFRQIAEVIGRRLGLPVVPVSGEEAEAHFGWFLKFAGTDMAVSSAKTRKRLGWTPSGPGLIEDIDQPAYFEVATSGG